ncbi:MAG: hypothetical protein AB8G99_14150 [Planctomycetaceae bacterium]
MKTLLTNLFDGLVTLLCSAGPLRAVGQWWWRRRLSVVHASLKMEHYRRRA